MNYQMSKLKTAFEKVKKAYGKKVAGPAKKEDIAKVEKELGFTLPPQLKAVSLT